MLKIRKVIVLFLLVCAMPAMAQWQSLNMGIEGGGTIADVQCVESYMDVLYAGTTAGVFRSASGNGGDWEKLGTGLDDVTVKILSLGASFVAYGTNNKLYVYDPVSAQWDETSYTGYVDQSIAQLTHNGMDYIFVPSWGGGVFTSTDGGLNWTQDTTRGPEQTAACSTCSGMGSKNILGLYTFPGDTVIYGLDKVTGGVQALIYSTDLGQTWHWRNVGYFFNPRSLLVRNYSGQRTLYYSGDNGNYNVKYTTDTGLTWLTSTKKYSFVLHMKAKDDQAIFAVQKDVGVIYSFDNGATWNAFNEGITAPAQTGNLAITDNFLYFANKTGGIWKYELSDDPFMTPGFPALSASDFSSATVDVKSALADEVYYVLIHKDSVAPSVLDVLAGKDGTGAGTLITGNTILENNVEKSVSLTGLTELTDYVFYAVLLTKSGNVSLVSQLEFTTPEEPKTSLASASKGRKETLVYPNPFSDIINISIESGVKWEVINSLGAVYASGEGKTRLDASGFAAGLYVLKVYDNDLAKSIKLVK